MNDITPGSYVRKKSYVGYLIIEGRSPVEKNGVVIRQVGEYNIKDVGKGIEVLWSDGTFSIEFSSMVEEIFDQ